MTNSDELEGIADSRQRQHLKASRRNTIRAWVGGMLALGEGLVRHIFLETALFCSVITVMMCFIAGRTPMQVVGALFGLVVGVAIVFGLRRKLSSPQQWLLGTLLFTASIVLMFVGWKCGLWRTAT